MKSTRSFDLSMLPGAPIVIYNGDIVASSVEASKILGLTGAGPHNLCALVIPKERRHLKASLDNPKPAALTVWLDSAPPVAVRMELGKGPDERLVTVQDVTEAEREHVIVSLIARSMFIVDETGTLLWRCQGAEQLTGVLNEEIVGLKHIALLHPEDIPAALEHLQDMHQNEGQRGEFIARSRVVDHETEDVWERLVMRGISAFEHPAIQGVLIACDLLEGELESDPITRLAGLSIAELAPVGIILSAPNGETLWGNRSAHDLLGPDFDPLYGTRWFDLARPADRPAIEAAVAAGVDNEEPAPLIVGVGSDEDPHHWLRVTVRPQRSMNGRPPGISSVLEDVTEEVQNRAERDHVYAMLDRTADLVAAFDRNQDMVWANARLHEVLGRRGLENGPQAFRHLIVGDPDAVVAEAIQSLRAHNHWECEIFLNLGETGPRLFSIIGVTDDTPAGKRSSLMVAREVKRRTPAAPTIPGRGAAG